MSFYLPPPPLEMEITAWERSSELHLPRTRTSVASPADHPQTATSTAHSSAVFSFILF